MKEYEPKVLLTLCAAIKGESNAQPWLKENGYPELSEFWDACEHDERSFKWLLENGHKELAAMVDGLHGNEKAKIFLVKSGHQELAIFIDAADGNKSAVHWLIKSHHKYWLAVAREIYLWNKKNEPKGLWTFLNIGNPFR